MENFSTFIFERLQQASLKVKYRYLLMDTSAIDSASLKLPILNTLPSIDLLREDNVIWKETVAPVLVQLPEMALTSAKNNLLLQFLQQWRWANAFIYLESNHPFYVLTKALSKRMHVQLSDAQDMLLRYFDTRIFASLLDVLASSQRSRFLEVAEVWHYPNRDGMLVSVQKSNNNASLIEQDAFISPLILSAQQEFKMLETSETDTMVSLLLSQHETPLNTMNPFQQHSTVDSLLNAARTYGITQFNEQSMFCIVGLALGTTFYNHEPWASGLMQVKNQGLRLSQFLSTLESFV